MSEIVPLEGLGDKTPSPLKKAKFNKKKLILYGGIFIAVFLVLSNLFKKQPTSSEAGGTIVEPTPSNSADVQAQMQNFSDIIQGQVDAALSSFESDMVTGLETYSENYDGLLTDQRTYFTEELKKQTDNFDAFVKKDAEEDAGYLKQINDLTKKNTDLTKKVTDAAKKQTDLTKKVEAISKPNKVVNKPAPAKTVSEKQQTINKIDANYKGGSIVDYLKSAGVNSSMSNRKELAKDLGIKNYKGTASQNKQMLKTLRSDGK